MVGQAVLSPAVKELPITSADGDVSDGASVFSTHAIDTSLEYDISDRFRTKFNLDLAMKTRNSCLHGGRKPGAKTGIPSIIFDT